MALATLFFWLGRKDFAHIPPRGLIYFRETFSFQSLRPIFRLTLIFSFVIMFWALFDQIGTTWQIQARSLDRVLPGWMPFLAAKKYWHPKLRLYGTLFSFLYLSLFSFYIYPFISRFLISRLYERCRLVFG